METNLNEDIPSATVLVQKMCPICTKPCDNIFSENENNQLLQYFINLVNLSPSQKIVWKFGPPKKEMWSLCGEDNCVQIAAQFVNLVQQLFNVKKEIQHNLKTFFEKWGPNCDGDVEEWSRELLDGFYNLDEKMLLDLSVMSAEESLVSSNQTEEVTIISNMTHNLDNTIKIDCSNVFTYEGQKLDSSSSSTNIIKGTTKRGTTGRRKTSGIRKTLQQINMRKSVQASTSSGLKSCDQCEKQFNSATSLRTHKRTHVREGKSADGTFHCTHCSSIFLTLSELKAHKSKEHEKPRDFCPICEKFMSKNFLQQHLHSHYMNNSTPVVPVVDVFCVICAKPFSSALLLASHMDVHKGDYSCEVSNCRKSFYSRTAKIKHVELIHAEGAEQLDCQYCYQNFKPGSEDEFQRHIRNHEDQAMKRTYLCENCGSYFRSKKTLQSHLRLNHPKINNNSEGHKCEVCEKSFLTPQRLKVHAQTHKNSATASPFTCPEPECGKAFSQKVSLDSHLMVHHSGKMRYKCTLCDHPGFTYSQGLRSHVYKHHNEMYTSGGKNNVCHVCYKNFVTEDELLLHVGNHEKLKCQLCSKQFKSMNHLKEHTLRHAAIRPFKCPHCPSKGYVRQAQLNEHMKKVHQDSELQQIQHHNNLISVQHLAERITYVIQIP